jgi:electron transport complex protein RnfD
MGPFIKSEKDTSTIMKHLLIALMPIVLFAYIKNGLVPFVKGYTNVLGLFYPLIFILIGTLSTFAFETIYKLIFEKKKIEDAIKNSYSIFPGLFLGLILPLNTPIVLLILASFVSSIIAKMLFGGFGNNIFNPALIGRLFIISAYAIVIGKSGGYLNSYEIDTISSGTPLTNAGLINGIGTYETLVKPYGGLLNFFIGTIPGAVGETSAFLCLLGFIYLTYFKAIKWKIPVAYILTVFAMTYVIGGMNNLGIWYPLFQIFSGGLMFGAVFMATDPVTSPVTPIGQILYGMFLGILTVIFRFLTPFPEGVLTSILTMNMLVMILDKIGAIARFNFKITIIPFVVAWLLILGLSVGISMNFNKEKKDTNFNIIEKTKKDNKTEYIVTQKGYSSTIKAKIIIENGKVIEFNILEQNDSFYQKLEEENYINKLKENKEADTVSGATITSTAIKTMLKNTLNDYGV